MDDGWNKFIPLDKVFEPNKPLPVFVGLPRVFFENKSIVP